VLIKGYEPERRHSAILIPDTVQGKMSMVDNRAVVVAIGESAWHDEPQPRARVGEKVLVTKFAGFMAKGPKDGELYRLVNDRDIFCAITHEETENV
jgi:co-chaperonin GroES (HSP10)